MTDIPDLLEQIERTLRDRIAPGGADARYHTALAANALAMVRRQMAQPTAADAPADVAAIRAGAHDDDPSLHARLMADARRRAWIADPTALDPDDRTLIEGQAHG